MMVVAPKKMTDRNFNETDEPEELDVFFICSDTYPYEQRGGTCA